MKLSWKTGAVAALAVLYAASMAAPATWADDKRGKYAPKHDSNTLHKLGGAIQYPFRKLGENTSVATHETVGHKSVVADKIHKENDVVTPGGHKIVKSYYGNYGRYAHHRHHRHHHHHHTM